MRRFPDYLGVTAFGVKMGVVLPGDDIIEEVYRVVERCFRDGLIDDGDVICVKENVVARELKTTLFRRTKSPRI